MEITFEKAVEHEGEFEISDPQRTPESDIRAGLASGRFVLDQASARSRVDAQLVVIEARSGAVVAVCYEALATASDTRLLVTP